MTAGRVAVVGTINRDVIVSPEGDRRESLGGILYNAMPLAALLAGSGITVGVHGRLGDADRREAIELLSAFPAIDPSGLIADPAGTNGSLLDYSGPGDRREEVRLHVAPLTAADLAGVAGSKAVLVNMISGQDVGLRTIRDLRRRVPGLFLLDIQALGRTADSPRRPRTEPEWRAWASAFDVVKGNEVEVAWFGNRPDDVRAAARAIREAGAGEVVATRGERGAWRLPAAEAADAGETRDAGDAGDTRCPEPAFHDVPPIHCPAPADPTGCGDAFLAGVCAGRVLGAPASVAAALGAFVASEVAGLSGLAALVRLEGVLARARRARPDVRDGIRPPDPRGMSL